MCFTDGCLCQASGSPNQTLPLVVRTNAGAFELHPTEKFLRIRQVFFNDKSSSRLCHRILKRKKSSLSATQEMYEVAGVVEIGRNILGLGSGVGILAALAWSGLPVLSASSGQKKRRNVDDEDAIGVKWGVMTVLSFLPLFNWLVCYPPGLALEYLQSDQLQVTK